MYFEKWREVQTHWSHVYATDTMAGLPSFPPPGKSPPWLKYQLPLGVQQRLLQRRSLATSLATHTPSSKRSTQDPFEESFCPLCARSPVAGRTHQITETFGYFTSECPPLQTSQEHLRLQLTAFLVERGGVLRDPSNLSQPEILTNWNELSEDTQCGLLMGNEVPAMSLVFTDRHERAEWMSEYLVTAHEPLHLLFTHRDRLLKALYPAPR